MPEDKQVKAQIKTLESELKAAYSDKKFDEVKQLADKVRALDPKNRLAKKLLEKVADKEAEMKAKENAEKVKPMVENFLGMIKEERFEAAKEKGNEILALDPNNKKVQKKLEKIAKLEAKAAKKAAKEKAEMEKAEQAKAEKAEKATKKEKEEAAEKSEGNVFTKLFSSEDQKSDDDEAEKPKEGIIDTIVQKKEEAPAEKKEAPKEEKKPKKESLGEGFLHFSRAFFQLSFAFVIISAGFFYVQNLDTDNRILSIVERENVASQLYSAAEELSEKQELERELNREIRQYKSGYDNKFEQAIEEVVETRIKWKDILAKIDEVTTSVYERNALAKYVVYDSYSFDKESGTIRISGTLSDPLGKNLTKLIELEKAFASYPGEPGDTEDGVESYFSDVSKIQSVSKSLDRRTNKYISNFQLSFTLNK